jgi:hypothetical protein
MGVEKGPCPMGKSAPIRRESPTMERSDGSEVTRDRLIFG